MRCGGGHGLDTSNGFLNDFQGGTIRAAVGSGKAERCSQSVGWVGRAMRLRSAPSISCREGRWLQSKRVFFKKQETKVG